jgi:type IV secretory pathway TraG/TraD family ATPase VirD4
MNENEKQQLNGVVMLLIFLLLALQMFYVMIVTGVSFVPEKIIQHPVVIGIQNSYLIWLFKFSYLLLIPASFRIFMSIDIAKKIKKEDQATYRTYYYILSLFVLLGPLGFPLFKYYNLILFPTILLVHIFVGSRGFAKVGQRLNEEDILARVNQKKLKEMGLVFDTDKGKMHVHNVFQGILVAGGAGAGKSASVIEPSITQWARQNMSMTIYDFKGNPPTLGLMAWNVWKEMPEEINGLKKPSFTLLSFDQIEYSVRPNPLHPKELKSGIDTRSITTTLLFSLKKEWVNKQDFWAESAINLCFAIGERLRADSRYHQFCTIPHLVVLATLDYKRLIDWLRQNHELSMVIASFSVARDSDAGSQLAGMISSLQSALATLLQPELFWIFGAEPEHQSTLNLNDPKNPQIMVLANNPKNARVISPLLSCCVRAIINQVNEQGKHPHAMVIDELPTIFIQDLSQLPATARSNKVSTMLGLQDESQLETQYGKSNADEILSNMGTQFVGMTNNPKTAKKYSDFFGTSHKKKTSYSTSDNSLSMSENTAQEKILQERDIANQPVGHFIGKVADGDPSFFSVQFPEFKKEEAVKEWKSKIELEYSDEFLKSLSKQNPELAKTILMQQVQLNYIRIQREALFILDDAGV